MRNNAHKNAFFIAAMLTLKSFSMNFLKINIIAAGLIGMGLLFNGLITGAEANAEEWYEAQGGRILLYKFVNEWHDCVENRRAAVHLIQDEGESRPDFYKRKEKALNAFPSCTGFCGNVITYVSKGADIEFFPVTGKVRLTFYWSNMTMFPSYKARFSCISNENGGPADVSYEGDSRVHVLLPVSGPGRKAVLTKNTASMRMEFTGMTGGLTGEGILFCDPMDPSQASKTAPFSGCDHYFSPSPKKSYGRYNGKTHKKDTAIKSETPSKPVCMPASIVIYLNDSDEILTECFQ